MLLIKQQATSSGAVADDDASGPGPETEPRRRGRTQPARERSFRTFTELRSIVDVMDVDRNGKLDFLEWPVFSQS